MNRAIPLIMVMAGSLVAAGWLAGCGHANTFNYMGDWVGHRKLSPDPKADPHVVEEVSTFRVTLETGGHFKMTDAGMPKEGEYGVEGNHAVLNVKSMLGRPMDRQPEDVQKLNVPITVTPVEGGRLKYFDPTGFDKEGLILERVATK